MIAERDVRVRDEREEEPQRVRRSDGVEGGEVGGRDVEVERAVRERVEGRGVDHERGEVLVQGRLVHARLHRVGDERGGEAALQACVVAGPA